MGEEMLKKRYVFITLLLIVCLFIIALPVSAADSTTPQSDNDAVTRGSRFTITVTGRPNTPYYVWLTRTFSMTGAPGDQPPIILGSLENVAQDPPGGPYTIGSYAFNNGNGRTIRDDVAPSTPEVSNTRYYALVTTDSDGRAVVAFQTSSSTAQKTFSIRVENPQFIDSGTVTVELGGVTRKPVTSTAETTTAAPTANPTMSMPTAVPSRETGTLTTAPLPTETPIQPVPLETGFCILAVGMGLLVVRKR